MLFKLLASGVSMRRSAIILGIHRVTVHRKLVYLAKKSRMKNQEFLEKLQLDRVTHMQFDDLITSEHTKLKPLSVSIAVDAKRRFILGAEVGKLPAFGRLASYSRMKYGRRESEHKEKLEILFTNLIKVIHPKAKIESDEHQNYPYFVEKYFPSAHYHRHKGGRGCVAGQGELKKLKYDPLFKLNHSAAMLRANINRLIRKTWCTTKSPDMLKNHLDIYIHFHNYYLL